MIYQIILISKLKSKMFKDSICLKRILKLEFSVIYRNIINKYFRFVRTFASVNSNPVVPHIKVEPSNYLDVDLGVNNDENRNADQEGNKK